MTGLNTIFALNKFLHEVVPHSNCHAVIDGSNLQYSFSNRSHPLVDFPDCEKSIRKFFQHFVNAGITLHIFFDGPTKSDPFKTERTRLRREQRLRTLIHGPNGTFMDYPRPSAIQDIFRDVAQSLGIPTIQVSASRDYTVEMVSHAKHFDAFIVSANTRFFLENIPRGFVHPDLKGVYKISSHRECIVKTFHYDKLARLIKLNESRNKSAVSMWRTLLLHRKTFENFTRHFLGGSSSARPNFYPKNRAFWMQTLLSEKCRRVAELKLLQFCLENTREDAERIIVQELLPGTREEGKLLLNQNIAAEFLEPNNVFERIESQIDSGRFCEENLPRWFLRYLTVECKLIPGLMDVITDRQHNLLTLLEDLDQASVNSISLHIRRVLYGILLADVAMDSEKIVVKELDREGDQLKVFDVTPVWKLCDADNMVEPIALPGLQIMDSLPESERLRLFLVALGVPRKFRQQVTSNEALYIFAIFKYWVAAAGNRVKKDLINVLLTVVFVEEKYSKTSHLFREPVKLNAQAGSDLAIEFCQEKVANVTISYARMHPLSQLQVITVFSRWLHRSLLQPLGPTVDNIESLTSELIFYQISQRTQVFTEDEELDEFVESLMDECSYRAFNDTVDLIWNFEDMDIASIMISGFRDDDVRP